MHDSVALRERDAVVQSQTRDSHYGCKDIQLRRHARSGATTQMQANAAAAGLMPRPT